MIGICSAKMPYRKTPIVSEQIYHVLNRSIAKVPIFLSEQEYRRFISLINYYQYEHLPLRFSHYNRLPIKQKLLFDKTFISKATPIVEIYAFCLMPNHFHFLIKSVKERGISDFMRKLQNAYSKYFNTKTDRTGSLFQFMFKAVAIETEEQLLHVSRYIHLNPYTAKLVTRKNLLTYKWSSLPDYVNDKAGLISINSKLVLDYFPDKFSYKTFVLDQADFQRELAKIKHLSLE